MFDGCTGRFDCCIGRLDCCTGRFDGCAGRFDCCTGRFDGGTELLYVPQISTLSKNISAGPSSIGLLVADLSVMRTSLKDVFSFGEAIN